MQSYLNNIESEKNQLLESNSLLAENNLTREPELVEGREKVAELSAEGEELSKIVEEKYKELSMSNHNVLDNIKMKYLYRGKIR